MLGKKKTAVRDQNWLEQGHSKQETNVEKKRNKKGFENEALTVFTSCQASSRPITFNSHNYVAVATVSSDAT